MRACVFLTFCPTNAVTQLNEYSNHIRIMSFGNNLFTFGNRKKMRELQQQQSGGKKGKCAKGRIKM